MLHAWRRLSGVKSSLLAGVIIVLTGCVISDDFKQAVDDFRSAGQQEDIAAETEVEAPAAVNPPATEIVVAAEDEAGPTSQALVLAVQKLLTQMGYEPGPIDGLLGRKTHQAVKVFQADTGAAVDGAVTADSHSGIDRCERGRHRCQTGDCLGWRAWPGLQCRRYVCVFRQHDSNGRAGR